MTDASGRKTLITRYLLGQASAEECAVLEDQYLRDDDLFEEMVAAESDLIDAYARGKLNALEQSQFETHFRSSAERRERIEFAKSLMNVGAAEKTSTTPSGKTISGGHVTQILRPSSPRGLRLAMGMALLVFLSGFLWLATTNRALWHQLDSARSAQADAQRQVEALRKQLADLQERTSGQTVDVADLPTPGSTILSLTLAPDLVRGAGQQQSTLRPPPGISEVRLLLKQNHDQYSTFAAVLETAEGQQVWRRSDLVSVATREGGRVIIIQMPPSVLSREDYVLRLFGTRPGREPNEISTYSFRVAP